MTLKPVLGGLAALAVAMGFGRFAYTPLLPWMQAAEGFDHATGGWLAGLNYLGYLAGALLLIGVTRPSLRRQLLEWSLLATVLSTAVMAVTDGVVVWGVARLISGLASAGVFILASAAVVGHLAEHGRPGLAGLHFAGVGIGIALSGVLVGWIAPMQGWRAGWLWLAALGSLLALLAWRWLPPPGAARPAAADGKPARLGLPMLLLAASYFCEGAGYIVTGTFLVAMARTTPALAPYGELSWTVVGLAAAPSAVLWSMTAARIGQVPALVVAHLVQAVGIVLPVLAPHPALVVASAMLYGGTFIGIVGIALSLGNTLAGGHASRAIAGLTAGYGVGQVLAPPVAGWLTDGTGNFSAALWMAAAAVVLGGALAAAIPFAGGGRRR